MINDPVCGGLVYEQEAAAWIEYEGHTYVFCSPFCKLQFKQNPAYYVAAYLPSAPRYTRRVVEPTHNGSCRP
jgi:YHS domain-containing protein